MSGSITVDLDNVDEIINNSTTFLDFAMEGIKDQSNLIGLAVGLTIAIGLLFGVVFLVLGVVPRLIGKIKTLKH